MNKLMLIFAFVLPAALAAAPLNPVPMENLPRKVLIGTMSRHFSGSAEQRFAQVREWIGKVADEAAKKYPGRKLDLVVTGECSVCDGQRTGPGSSPKRALEVDRIVAEFAPVAKSLGTYLALGAIFWDKASDGSRVPRNGVIFLDREGKLKGIYRKVHLAIDWDDPDPKEAEAGLIPGTDFPVFDCDFGKVGFLVCFDMSYPDGWAELKRKGAEIVAIPTASPQTFRPAMFAHIHQYYVVTSTRGSNATILDPLGLKAAQVEGKDRVLVAEIDLSFAIIHWSSTLRGGRKFVDAYGADKVGFRYGGPETNGIFWSNDPKRTIGDMMRGIKLNSRDDSAAQAKRVQDLLRK